MTSPSEIPGQPEEEDFLPHESDSLAPDQDVPGMLGPDDFLYIGRGLTSSEFQEYVRTYNFGSQPPDYIVLHHTGEPGTLHAPNGNKTAWDAGEIDLSDEQIYNRRRSWLERIRNYYINTYPTWDRGPHLFIDDRYIWLFTPMYHWGIHAKWGNYFQGTRRRHYAVGIEVIGNYSRTRWPEPVANLVGDAVAMLKQQLQSFELQYQYPDPATKPGLAIRRVNNKDETYCPHPERLRHGAVSSHRDYNKPECPGNAIDEQFYIEVLQQRWEHLNRL